MASSVTSATIGLPMLLGHNEGAPVWSLGVGALGIASAVAGVVLLVRRGQCVPGPDGRCGELALATPLGELFLLQAVPLLAIPVTHWVRSLNRDESSVSVDLGRSHLLLRYTGQL